MAYLDRRVDRYTRFQELLNKPHSRQCGNAFILQTHDGPIQTIRPRLEFLGAGAFGAAFAVVDPFLTARNIRTVIKLADRNNPENTGEIIFGYVASDLVKDGITPHLPLYTRCRRPNDHANPSNVQNCNCNTDLNNVGCNFERGHGNPHGNIMTFSPSFLGTQKHINYNLRKIDNCLVSFSERLDGSFKSLMAERIDAANTAAALNAAEALNIRSDADNEMTRNVLGLFAQISFGLKAMRQTPHGSWVHRDLHPDNILYKDGINPPNPLNPLHGQFIKYHINGSDYYIKHNNRLFVLWDFGKVKQISHVAPGADPGVFINEPLDYDYAHDLNRWFHLSGAGAYFAPPITAVQTNAWRASYHYDIARLAAGIHTLLPPWMTRTKVVCMVLLKHFIGLLNDGNAYSNLSVDPITFINIIGNAFVAHGYANNPANPEVVADMAYAINEWIAILNKEFVGGEVVHIIPPANQILKKYPIVPPGFHFGKAKKLPKSVRKAKKSPKK